jgi:transposase
VIQGFREEAGVNRDRFWLTEEQFARIAPHLPTDTRGKARVDDRRVISGIVHVLKSGGRWIDAPAEYGPRKTLYNRYVRWAAKGVWVDLFHALASAGGPPAQVLIDSSAVKAHRSASGGNVWPAPSASSILVAGLTSLQKRIRPPGKRLGPRWRSARSGPHKGGGIECHFTP